MNDPVKIEYECFTLKNKQTFSSFDGPNLFGDRGQKFSSFQLYCPCSGCVTSSYRCRLKYSLDSNFTLGLVTHYFALVSIWEPALAHSLTF